VQLRPSSGSSTGGTVRKLTQTTAEPVAIRPTRYDQAKEIADLLKSGQPVAMNIGAADSEIARRLIDFASGVIYGIEGSMEKIAPGVFLLTPRGTRVIRD
jgi:cell division inhibitor SepF